MRLFPIIPIWLMTCFCIVLIYIIVKHSKKNTIQISIIIILFMINLRPMIPTSNAIMEENNLEVLFVIDNTISMNAEDYNGKNKRLDAVKEDCLYIVEQLMGAKFSIITFSNSSKILVPFTKDATMASESIEIIEPIDEFYARGSSLNTPLETMEEVLKRQSEKSEDKKRILFYISDGEITDDSTLTSYKSIAKYVDDGAVLGYGTSSGGYMKSYDKLLDRESYVEDNKTFTKAVSKLDEDNLKSIAKDIDLDYIHMEKQSNISSKINKIKRATSSNIESVNKLNYDDIYYIFILPLIILITLELKKFRRYIR